MGEATTRRVGETPKRRVLQTADGGFMCKANYALDVAFMMSCAEGLVVSHRDVDRMELGDLLFRYIDGDLSTDEVRKEIADWREELDQDAAAPTEAGGEREGEP